MHEGDGITNLPPTLTFRDLLGQTFSNNCIGAHSPSAKETLRFEVEGRF